MKGEKKEKVNSEERNEAKAIKKDKEKGRVKDIKEKKVWKWK